LRTVWNREVGPTATASNGVVVHLTPEVQDKIRSAYVDGKAIRVRLANFKWYYCPPTCCPPSLSCICSYCPIPSCPSCDGCCPPSMACCTAQCTAACPCIGCLCACNDRVIIDSYFPVYDLYYGQADQPASCPNYMTKICWMPQFFGFCEKHLDIDIRDVQVKGAPVKQWMA